MDIWLKRVLFASLSLFVVVGAATGAVVLVRLARHQAVWIGQPAVLSVSGTGKVLYTPDMATVRIAVIAKGADPVQVQEENNKNMQGVITYLKESGIVPEDIQTTTYTLYPEYSLSDRGMDTSKIIGYTLHQGITCKVRKDLEKVGSIIAGLADAGANSIDAIEFSLSDEAKQALGAQAKAKAIGDAQAQLQALRASLGFRVLRLTSVQDSPVWPMDTMRSYAMKEGLGSGVPAPIELGTDELVSNVVLTFEVK